MVFPRVALSTARESFPTSFWLSIRPVLMKSGRWYLSHQFVGICILTVQILCQVRLACWFFFFFFCYNYGSTSLRCEFVVECFCCVYMMSCLSHCNKKKRVLGRKCEILNRLSPDCSIAWPKGEI